MNDPKDDKKPGKFENSGINITNPNDLKNASNHGISLEPPPGTIPFKFPLASDGEDTHGLSLQTDEPTELAGMNYIIEDDGPYRIEFETFGKPPKERGISEQEFAFTIFAKDLLNDGTIKPEQFEALDVTPRTAAPSMRLRNLDKQLRTVVKGADNEEAVLAKLDEFHSKRQR